MFNMSIKKNIALSFELPGLDLKTIWCIFVFYAILN